MNDAETKNLIRAQFDQWGVDEVRHKLHANLISRPHDQTAAEWLAERDREAARLEATSQAEIVSASSRAAVAAERAATAAEAQAITAKHALITAIAATIIAAIALIVSIIGFLHVYR